MRRLILALLFAAGLPTAHATPVYSILHAAVEVSPQGKVSEMAWQGQVPALLAGSLAQHVQELSFVPATSNGAPASARTGVSLIIKIEEVEEQVQFHVIDVQQTGLWMASSQQAPRYPADKLRAGENATIYLSVDYDAEGKVTRIDAPEDRALQSFVSATKQVAKHWRFTPETVNGVPVAGSIVVPVTFQMAGRRTEQSTLKLNSGETLTVYRQAPPVDTLQRSVVTLKPTSAVAVAGSD